MPEFKIYTFVNLSTKESYSILSGVKDFDLVEYCNPDYTFERSQEYVIDDQYSQMKQAPKVQEVKE